MYKVNYFSLEKKNEDVKSITFHSKKKRRRKVNYFSLENSFIERKFVALQRK